MTDNQLTYFVTLVESNTFLEASDKLNLSQSSLSKYIMNLEKELDLKLFDRSKRHAILTDAGKIFYQDALHLLDIYQEVHAHLKPYKETYHGSIHLGTLPFLTQYGITSVLKHFSDEYPGIQLNIEEVEDEQLMYGLRQGTYEIAITRNELLKDHLHKSYLLTNDELLVLLPPSHPLASNTCIELGDLKDEHFIFMHKHISIYQLCVDACQRAGFTPHILRTARIETILSAVAAGEGVSLLCRKNLNIFNHNGVVALPLSCPVNTSVVLATMLKGKSSPNINILIKYIKKNYELV